METKNSQEYKLFHCSECGTIFKCSPNANFDIQTGLTVYTTDLGSIIPVYDIPSGLSRSAHISQWFTACYIWICPKCGQLLEGEPINCEDWVAEKVFSIKGDAPTSKPLS